VVYLLSWCLIVNTTVMAAPSGGVFTVGTGTIVEGANTAVTVNRAQSIVQWGAPGSPGSGGIDTVAGESLTFLQAAGLSNSAVLNRIMSGNPTQFNGALNGLDMRIFIVNPAGIIFGGIENKPQINVSQLVASGLNMSDADFLSATGASPTDFRFEGGAWSPGKDGVVKNWGTIQANSIYLVGRQVTNKGADITAPNGLIVLAAGDNVYLAQDGSNVLVELEADPRVDWDPAEHPDWDPDDKDPRLTNPYDIDNRSGIHARNGTIILAAGDTFSRAINNSSWLVAQGGSIEMQAARIENTGVITTSTDDGDGGDIKLTGIDEVIIATDAHPGQEITADGGANGGTITIESAGTVTIGAGTLVSARGGNVSGDGGSVKITGEHFVIAGQIDASPGNTDYEPGTLEIDPAIVTIATGANAGAVDTLYENDIETWGTKGTSLVVKADSGITVQNITDGEIKGRYGNIELYATGAESLVSFEDTTDTISTTLGDIRMTAGAGGLNIGNLQTGGENLEATPGEIHLSTHDGGDITAENLIIHGGQGHAEINVDAADDLTINGDVSVGKDLPGSDSPIYNVLNGQDAEAMIYLKAGDDVVLNGDVRADSHGLNEDIEGSVTKSYIGIFSGTGVPVFGSTTVNGDLVSTAKASSNGTSNATIEINAWGTITWGPEAAAPLADGDAGQVHVQSKTSAEDTDPDGDVARIIISAQGHVPQVVATPDVAQTHMGALVQGNVLTNDVDPDPQGNAMTATLVQGPTHATNFVLNANGSYSYTPQAGYVGTDTFTYTAGKGGVSSAPVSVTITMANALPVAGNDTAATTQNVAVIINVLANDSDADSDPLTAALVNGPANGTLTQNADKTFTYKPAKSFSGQDTFTYSITDGQTGAVPAQATVAITVNPMAPPSSSPAAPGLERVDFELSGCPALVKWAATELGVGARAVEVRIANALALTRDIQPCSSCADLKDAAMILKDADGTHVAALTQIVNEFAAAGAPPTEEQMATIADTIAKNAKGNNRYAVAGEYLDAVAQYVGVLVGKLGFSTEESVLLVTDKYINRLAQTGNANVAAMVAKLAVLAAK
jgi:filamentous hemagglutinin family protein